MCMSYSESTKAPEEATLILVPPATMAAAQSSSMLPSLPGAGDDQSSEGDIDKFIDLGNLALAERKLHDIPTDHGDYVIEK